MLLRIICVMRMNAVAILRLHLESREWYKAKAEQNLSQHRLIDLVEKRQN